MANFFKQYSEAYKKKHSGDKIEIDLTIPKNTGTTVPNPTTLGNNKKPLGKFIKVDNPEE